MPYRHSCGDSSKMSENQAAVKLRQAPLGLLARTEGQRNSDRGTKVLSARRST